MALQMNKIVAKGDTPSVCTTKRSVSPAEYSDLMWRCMENWLYSHEPSNEWQTEKQLNDVYNYCQKGFKMYNEKTNKKATTLSKPSPTPKKPDVPNKPDTPEKPDTPKPRQAEKPVPLPNPASSHQSHSTPSPPPVQTPAIAKALDVNAPKSPAAQPTSHTQPKPTPYMTTVTIKTTTWVTVPEIPPVAPTPVYTDSSP